MAAFCGLDLRGGIGFSIHRRTLVKHGNRLTLTRNRQRRTDANFIGTARPGQLANPGKNKGRGMTETVQIALITAVINGAVTWGIISTKLEWLRRDIDELKMRVSACENRHHAAFEKTQVIRKFKTANL